MVAVHGAANLGEAADLAEAASWYGLGAQQGDPQSAACIGWMLLHGADGVERDTESARGWLLLAAERGEPLAMCALGEGYECGSFGVQDHATARGYFEKAAMLGFAPAAWNLARCHLYGLGVPSNKALAYFWLLIAAAGGFTGATDVRDRLAVELSAHTLLKVQRLARNWRPIRN